MTPRFLELSGRYTPEKLAFIQSVLDGDEPFLKGDFLFAAAQEVVVYFGLRSVEDLRRLRPMILTRAWARLRAEAGRPRGANRTELSRDQVTLTSRSLPYSAFFAVEETTLTHRRFDGTQSEEMTRAAFLMADAVTVLPYDPRRDRVLVVEQFRFGPYARGDQFPWMIEPIAGRVDPGELPEATARREAMEEAGVTLGALHQVAAFYPSAGAMTEFIISYVALADLPDTITGIGGVLGEHEDIASSLLSFETLMEMCDASQLDVAPLYMSAFWLARHRERLRQNADA